MLVWQHKAFDQRQQKLWLKLPLCFCYYGNLSSYITQVFHLFSCTAARIIFLHKEAMYNCISIRLDHCNSLYLGSDQLSCQLLKQQWHHPEAQKTGFKPLCWNLWLTQYVTVLEEFSGLKVCKFYIHPFADVGCIWTHNKSKLRKHVGHLSKWDHFLSLHVSLFFVLITCWLQSTVITTTKLYLVFSLIAPLLVHCHSFGKASSLCVTCSFFSTFFGFILASLVLLAVAAPFIWQKRDSVVQLLINSWWQEVQTFLRTIISMESFGHQPACACRAYRLAAGIGSLCARWCVSASPAWRERTAPTRWGDASCPHTPAHMHSHFRWAFPMSGECALRQDSPVGQVTNQKLPCRNCRWFWSSLPPGSNTHPAAAQTHELFSFSVEKQHAWVCMCVFDTSSKSLMMWLRRRRHSTCWWRSSFCS